MFAIIDVSYSDKLTISYITLRYVKYIELQLRVVTRVTINKQQIKSR